MHLLSHISGAAYEKYRSGLTARGVAINEASAAHPKLGKIAAIANVPAETEGAIVYLDADLVLLRDLTEDDFEDAAGADLAGVEFGKPWSTKALPSWLEPWRPTNDYPALNSGLLWFANAATARAIGAAWLTRAQQMFSQSGSIRDELALAKALDASAWEVVALPAALNTPRLGPATIGWHDFEKSLPAENATAWLTGRTTVATAPVRVPTEIANWRAKAVLQLAGLSAGVEAAIDALSEPQKTVVRHAWDGGAPLARHGPTVTALAPALGLTDAQVDALFLQAATLEV